MLSVWAMYLVSIHVIDNLRTLLLVSQSTVLTPNAISSLLVFSSSEVVVCV